MTTSVRDVNLWLEKVGINRKWADTILSQVKKQYPHLGQAVSSANSNRASLDAVLLVHHMLEGRFPVSNKAKRTDSPSV